MGLFCQGLSSSVFGSGTWFQASFKDPRGPLGTSGLPTPPSHRRMYGEMEGGAPERRQGAQHVSSPIRQPFLFDQQEHLIPLSVHPCEVGSLQPLSR